MKNKEKEVISSEEMTDELMYDLLVELVSTPYWPAIVRHNNLRSSKADDALRSIDPFKMPTEMARSQGIRSGIRDLEETIVMIIENRKKNENQEERK